MPSKEIKQAIDDYIMAETYLTEEQLEEHRIMFYIGQTVVIRKRPALWASELSKFCPIDDNVKYPFKGKIINIAITGQSEEDVEAGLTPYVAAKIGKYGFDMSALIIEDIIKPAKRQTKTLLADIIKANRIHDLVNSL